MNKLKNIFNNLSIFKKIILIVIMILLISVSSTMYASKILTNEIYNSLYLSLADNLAFSAKEIHNELIEIEEHSFSIIGSSSIQDSIENLMIAIYTSDNYKYFQYYGELADKIGEANSSFENSKSVPSISLYVDAMPIVTNAFLPADIPNDVLINYIDEIEAARGSGIYINDPDYGVFYGRAVLQTKHLTLDNLAILLYEIDFKELLEQANEYKSTENLSYLIYDENGLIYSSIELSESDYKTLSDISVNDYDILTLGDTKQFVLARDIIDTDFKYICLMPFDIISQQMWKANLTFYCIIVLAVILALIFSWFIVRSVSKHFEYLTYKIKYFRDYGKIVENQNYDYSNRYDEVGVLHTEFDQMAETTIKLIDENYKSDILCKEAQIKALEMQINPHFLYNTLESINWRAKALKEPVISNTIESLGKVLRILLGKKNNNFSIENEFELVDSYMTIQQIRFEDRINYIREIPSEILEYKIPRLSLQPILENAIKYSVEKVTETCTITVKGKIENDIINIIVSNDNSEFSKDFLNSFKTYKSNSGFGIGLKNIDNRLKLTFGNEFGLSFKNENECAVVSVTISALKSLGGDENF